MNYCAIKRSDVANGPGMLVTLFVSGCTNRCPGCFQPETWDFNYGEPFTKEVEDRIIELLTPSYISGLTLLGGEPAYGRGRSWQAEQRMTADQRRLALRRYRRPRPGGHHRYRLRR